MEIMNELNFASNVWGKLNGLAKARIQAFVDNPTTETWDECHTLILNGKTFLTLWQAVIAVDPSFPKTGRCEDVKGLMLKDWKAIPTVETLRKAIFYATH